MAFSMRFKSGISKYARIKIIHGCFIALTFAGTLGRFQQLPRDPAIVNA